MKKLLVKGLTAVALASLISCVLPREANVKSLDGIRTGVERAADERTRILTSAEDLIRIALESREDAAAAAKSGDPKQVIDSHVLAAEAALMLIQVATDPTVKQKIDASGLGPPQDFAMAQAAEAKQLCPRPDAAKTERGCFLASLFEDAARARPMVNKLKVMVARLAPDEGQLRNAAVSIGQWEEMEHLVTVFSVELGSHWAPAATASADQIDVRASYVAPLLCDTQRVVDMLSEVPSSEANGTLKAKRAFTDAVGRMWGPGVGAARFQPLADSAQCPDPSACIVADQCSRMRACVARPGANQQSCIDATRRPTMSGASGGE